MDDTTADHGPACLCGHRARIHITAIRAGAPSRGRCRHCDCDAYEEQDPADVAAAAPPPAPEPEPAPEQVPAAKAGKGKRVAVLAEYDTTVCLVDGAVCMQPRPCCTLPPTPVTIVVLDRVEPTTPPVAAPVPLQRCCNGCGAQLGAATDDELAAAGLGRALPDVRGECPACRDTVGGP